MIRGEVYGIVLLKVRHKSWSYLMDIGIVIRYMKAAPCRHVV